MKILDMPKTERPREKLLKHGRESLSTAELIALIMGSGGKGKSAMDIAMSILEMGNGRLGFLCECSPEELMGIEGVGRARACEIVAAVELGRRALTRPPEEKKTITCSSDVAGVMMNKMRDYKKEHFVAILLNAKGQIISESTVSIGDLTSSMTHPREVYVEAVRKSACSVIFVHNHPSGDPAPSREDIETTRHLMEAGKLLSIPVMDHIIIGDGTYISLKAEGYMENFN